jgi:hypothetical protein
MAGYDIVATNPDKNSAARIQVKSRWRTKADGFIIKNFECDFVIVTKLNRGSRDGTDDVLPPEYYAECVKNSETKWIRNLKNIRVILSG